MAALLIDVVNGRQCSATPPLAMAAMAAPDTNQQPATTLKHVAPWPLGAWHTMRRCPKAPNAIMNDGILERAHEGG